MSTERVQIWKCDFCGKVKFVEHEFFCYDFEEGGLIKRFHICKEHKIQVIDKVVFKSMGILSPSAAKEAERDKNKCIVCKKDFTVKSRSFLVKDLDDNRVERVVYNFCHEHYRISEKALSDLRFRITGHTHTVTEFK